MTNAMISYHTQSKQGPRTKIVTLKRRIEKHYSLKNKKHNLFSSSGLSCTQDFCFCFLKQSCCLYSNNETLNKNQLSNNKFQMLFFLFEDREWNQLTLNTVWGKREERGVEETWEPTWVARKTSYYNLKQRKRSPRKEGSKAESSSPVFVYSYFVSW